MPKLLNRLPKYRKHTSGQAFVELCGKRHYLGKWKSAESKAEYERLTAEWLAAGRQIAPAAQDATVNEITLAFWTHAESYYRLPDGSPSTEIDNYRLSLRPLIAIYGHTPAAQFGPLELQAVRMKMIESGLARRTINQRVGRVKRLFQWAVSNALIPANVYHGLQAVDGLKMGRSAARETEPVRPVPDNHVNAVVDHLPPQLAACVELQRITGMRSTEVLSLRGCDLDVTGELWVYRPPLHKTAFRGHDKTIHLGPKAQAIIRPWLKADTQAFLFSPAEVMEAIRAAQRSQRKTPLTPSQAKRRGKRNPEKRPGDRYTARSYQHAIRQTIRRLNADADEFNQIPKWHPHQLRHNAATRLRKEYGIEAARVVLGHRSAAITEVYAEIDHAKAADVMLKVG
jgi:integrase